jgi:hypothetical protein
MSEFASLRALLKQAYDAGTHLAAPDFDTWLAGVAGGDLTSALADMISTERVLPDLQPGAQIPTRQGDYVVRSMHRDGGETFVELQDFVSYERQHMVQAVPSSWEGPLLEASPRRAQCTTASCTLQVGHAGEHRGQFFHPNAGKTACRCDGPPHVYSPGWCPDSGPVVDPQFQRPPEKNPGWPPCPRTGCTKGYDHHGSHGTDLR